ncbi:MAG: 16S rRNA (uracil(1498)-N(3))-methyltransferase [Deltaproteobacteria bacterium]|nr:16S rRNA (uracil(1498)-N(3))-methyltransferase [Deltaproteobacteria bacterium]
MRRFFLNKSSILSGNPALTGSDVRHIRNVLRLEPGDRIMIFDGEGTEYECKIVSISPQCITLSILHSTQVIRESPVCVTIAQACLKGSKMDWVIQKVTELGVTTYIPFWAQRSVPKFDSGRAKSRYDRWTKIAHEALKQCGRSVAPEIKPLGHFDEIIRSEEEYDLKMIFCIENIDGVRSETKSGQDRVSGPDTSLKYFLDGMPKAEKIIGVIGPEGGFTSAEINAAIDYGYVQVSLGPRILRGETAAITVAAILQYVYGGLRS